VGDRSVIGYPAHAEFGAMMPSREDLEQIYRDIDRVSQLLDSVKQRVTGRGASETEQERMIRLTRGYLKLREQREQALPGLFSDPAWEILLEGFANRLEHRRVSISSMCIASRSPSTTALRYIQILEDRGFLARYPDRFDGRRVYISLTDDAFEAVYVWMTKFLAMAREISRTEKLP